MMNKEDVDYAVLKYANETFSGMAVIRDDLEQRLSIVSKEHDLLTAQNAKLREGLEYIAAYKFEDHNPICDCVVMVFKCVNITDDILEPVILTLVASINICGI